jgi:hypothetical protein
LLVGGITIHFLLGLSIDKNVIVSKSNSIINIWSTIKYMIIDGISMVDYNMVATMHLKLQKLKSNILPFNGINIMFMRNFLQFSPLTDTLLYSENVQPIFAFTKMTQNYWNFFMENFNSS